MSDDPTRLFGGEPFRVDARENIYSLSFSDTGRRIAAAVDRGVIVWQRDEDGNWKELRRMVDVGFCVVFLPGGQQLLASSSTGDRNVALWDVDTGERLFVFAGHRTMIRSICLLTGTDFFVTCSEDQTIRVWSLSRRMQVAFVNGTVSFYSASVRPDMRHLAVVGEEGFVGVWDISAALTALAAFISAAIREVRTWIGDEENVSVQFSPDGRHLAAGSISCSITIHTVSNDEYNLIRTLRGHEGHGAVRSLCFLDNARLFSGGDDAMIKLWDIDEEEDGGCIQTNTAHRGQIYAVTVSPDGQLLASGGADEQLFIHRRGGVDVEALFGDIKNAANDND